MKKLILLFVGLLFWASGSVGQNLSEGFENEFPVPPLGWTVYYASSDPAESNLVTHQYDGSENNRYFCFASMSFTLDNQYDQYLVTPELIVIEEGRKISFDYKRYEFNDEVFRVGWSSTGNAITDFTWSNEISDIPYTQWRSHVMDLPIATKYVAIHYMSKHKTSLYIDNVIGPALYVANGPPNCAVISSPANAASNMPIETTLRWSSGGGAPIGYKLFFGTDGGGTSTPVNIENGTNQPSAYLPVGFLDYNTTYYWQVVPSNDFGDATGCPIWSFTTVEEPTLSTFPHTENFDGLWLGNPAAPELWKVVNANNDNYTWRQTLDYYTSSCRSAPYAADGTGNTNDYLISPSFDLTGVYAKLQWWDKVKSEYYPSSYKVLISTTTTDISAFTTELGTFHCNNINWTEHEFDLAAFKDQRIYVAFYQFASASLQHEFVIDDVSITKAPDNAVFNISPEVINLGTNYIGATSTQTFTISNTGAGPLEITSVALDETGSDKFDLTHSITYPYELGYGESLTFDVNFTPTNDESQTASLVISYSPDGLTHNMSYTGAGIPLPPIGFVCQNPLSLAFPAYAIEGNTADYGNDYLSEDIGIDYDIHANYMNGYDVVYQFTLEDGGYLGGTILSKVYHIGAFIFEDCPNSVNPPLPLFYDVNQDLKMANFWYNYIPAGTYYLIITSWAEPYESEIPEYKIYLNFHETQPPDQSIFMGEGFWSDIHSWTFGGPDKATDAQPGYVTDVVIDGHIIVDGEYACNNLTIGPEGSITFNEGSKLSILEVPTIESDYTGTGSFIANDDNYIIRENSDNENTVKIERYLTGGWEGDNTGWHQISSPVKDQGIDAFHAYLWDYDFYAWGETENLWLNYNNPEGWTGGESFNLGQGYLISYPEAENWKEFTGKLNNNSITKTNLSKTGASNSGWHLLGNPFPSALKWNDGNWALSNVAGNAKIWHEDNKSYSDIAANGIIPSAQGFMVQVSSASNNLTIPAASRVHDATPYYKSTNEQLLLVAAETEGGSAQESKIIVNSMATEGFDFEFDSRFLAGYGPLLYSVVGDELLSTNSLPELNSGKVIPFGFVKNAATHFTIELKESIPGRVVYLTDNKTATVTNLTETSVYSFTSDEGDDANRFLLSFGTLGINNPAATDGVQVYAYGDVLYVATSTKETALVNVYNLTGQLVMQAKTGGNTLTTLNASVLNNGIYVVNIILNEGVVSRKVVIRK
jgi:hypothetical protein